MSQRDYSTLSFDGPLVHFATRYRVRYRVQLDFRVVYSFVLELSSIREIPTYRYQHCRFNWCEIAVQTQRKHFVFAIDSSQAQNPRNDSWQSLRACAQNIYTPRPRMIIELASVYCHNVT